VADPFLAGDAASEVGEPVASAPGVAEHCGTPGADDRARHWRDRARRPRLQWVQSRTFPPAHYSEPVEGFLRAGQRRSSIAVDQCFWARPSRAAARRWFAL